MAIDAELLRAATAGQAALRFYQWSAPTVTLGYFQARGRVEVPRRFVELDCVERLSGGGAILHDRELTYSLALPATHTDAHNPSTYYDAVHAAIIEVLAKSGISARLRGDDAFADQSFLCYLRGDARDILIGNHKIVGSAQRRRQGAVLQHGSILLRQSPQTPEFPGILELTGIDLNEAELAAALVHPICERLQLQPMLPARPSENLACDGDEG